MRWFQCGVQNFRRRDQCFKCGGPKTDIDAGEGADEVSPHPTSSKCLKIVFVQVCTSFEKSNFCPKIQFRQNFTFKQFFYGNQSCQPPNIFTSFSPEKFSTTFLGKSKLSKISTFSWVFQPKVFRQFFSWNQSCLTLQHFHEFFKQKKFRHFFSWNQSC